MRSLGADHVIVPVLDGPYALRELPEALRYFGEARHKGKVVVHWRGNGNGTFTAVPYTSEQFVDQNPEEIVLGDFDKDGKTDAATTKFNAEWSSMQNVGGKLAQKAEYTTGGGFAGGIATGDFDGDGNADIAVAATDSKEVYTFFGAGDGTFTAGATTIAFPHAQRQPVDVEAGDLNGDGKDDLAILINNPSSSAAGANGPLKIALSNGAARTFGTPADFDDLPTGYELLVKDIDGDGDRDVVIASWYNGLVVFPGNGNGTFATSQSFGAAVSVLGLAIDDFDRDGGPDVVGTVKRTHVSELRNAANAVRALASLGAMTWSEPSPQIVRTSHLTELRTGIAAARASLGLPAVSYTDASLSAGMTVKAVHFEQLRNAMR